MIDITPLVRLGLVLARAGMVIMTVPPFGSLHTPPTVKIGLTLLLTLALAPLVHVPADLSLAAYGSTIARELAIGLALSMAVRVTVAGAEFGGHLAGMQMGFGYVSLIDPSSGARNQMMSLLYGNLAVMALLLTDGHHAVLRTLVSSYQTLPLGGSGAISAGVLVASGRMLGLVLVLGVQLAAPVIIALLLVEVALGLLSRSVPALNMMTIGFGLRLLVGLIVLGAVISAVPNLSRAMLRQAFDASDILASALK